MSKLIVANDFDKLQWRDILVAAAIKAEKNKGLAGDLSSLKFHEIPLGDIKVGVFEAVSEFWRDPAQLISGGNVNSLQVFEKLFVTNLMFKIVSHFCIIYICCGKNFSKMEEKGSKTSARTIALKKVTKQMNLKTRSNTSGFQPEAAAGAFSFFMCVFRVRLGTDRLIPEIDQQKQDSYPLSTRYRWVGSLVCIPMVQNAETIAKNVRDYDNWVQDYIAIRRKDPSVSLSGDKQKLINERLATNRTYYLSQMKIYSEDVKIIWSKDVWAYPRRPEDDKYFTSTLIKEVEKLTGYKISRDADFPTTI